MKLKNKILILIVIPIVILIGIFFLLTKKNTSADFNKKTILINENLQICLDVSKMNIDEAYEHLIDLFEDSEFKIKQKNEVIDSIMFKDLNLKNNIREELELAKKQNDDIFGFKKLKENTINLHITYEATKNDILENISDLNCINKFQKSENAYIKKENNELVIVPEVYGNEIDRELFIEQLSIAIKNNKTELDLDKINVYLKPNINKEDSSLLEKVNIYNKCVNIKFNYLFGDKKEEVTKEMISSWIDINDNNEVIFNDELMLSHIKKLATTYNTFGSTRTFTTSNGKTIKVPSGDYGWAISQTKEVEALKQDLLNGANINREPIWLYKGYGPYINKNDSDIGDTYVEMDISNQHLWLYIAGELKLESDFVSGKESNGNGTPSGVFGLTYKTRNAVLRGPGYASPVKYWMPFNMNIGMHDASWRNSFGGNIYKNSGSHGCINLPTEKAKKIYDYIDTFFPIIVYNSKELKT